LIDIRPITTDDWYALYELIDQVDKDLVGRYSETEELVEDWINSIEERLWEVYVAILPQQEITKERNKLSRILFPWRRFKPIPSGIVGVITLYADFQREEDINEGEFDIGITVAEPFQRRGIGRQLIDFLLERGKKLELEKATLWTRVDNEAMIKLARKIGFVRSDTKYRYGYYWIQFIYPLSQENKKEK
jgi:RimJ/RimL family protein N-acetyltransferase